MLLANDTCPSVRKFLTHVDRSRAVSGGTREGRRISKSTVAAVQNNIRTRLVDRRESAGTPVLNGETNNSIFKRAVDPWTDDGSHFGTFDNRRSSITERSYGSEVCIWAPGEGDETG